jgi:hypothetical protein
MGRISNLQEEIVTLKSESAQNWLGKWAKKLMIEKAEAELKQLLERREKRARIVILGSLYATSFIVLILLLVKMFS